MVELNTVLQVVPALSVVVALLYYSITIRNTEKTRRKDFIFQSNLARTTEYFDTFFNTYDMWDYETYEEFNKKYSREQQARFNWLVNIFNVIGILMLEGVASKDEILRLYPPSPMIHLFELSWPWIRDIRKDNPEFFKPFELLYLEARKKLPDFVPHWQMGMRSTRAIHP